MNNFKCVLAALNKLLSLSCLMIFKGQIFYYFFFFSNGCVSTVLRDCFSNKTIALFSDKYVGDINKYLQIFSPVLFKCYW